MIKSRHVKKLKILERLCFEYHYDILLHYIII